MAEQIKLGVDTGGAEGKIDRVEQSLESLGQTASAAESELADLAKTLNAFLSAKAQLAGKAPRLLDTKQDKKALEELKQQFQEILNLSKQNGGIGAAVSIANGVNRPRIPSQVNFGQISSSPKEQAQFMERMLTRLLTHHLGTSRSPINTGLTANDLAARHGQLPPPPGPAPSIPSRPRQPDTPNGMSQAARHLAGRAMAGTSGGISEALTSAGAGAARGLGGLLPGGLLGGGLIGAAGYGLFKAASTMSEGLDKSKAEAIEIDKFKRQLGDVGVNFDNLRDHIREAANGVGLSFEQAGKMAQIFAKEANTSSRDTAALGEETANAAAVSRATGIDGDAIARFFGEMRASRETSNVQDSRKLALSIADAIKRSGSAVNADKMLESMASFSERIKDLTLGRANVGAYGGMLSGMVGDGLKAGTASSILNQFDSSVRSGGGSEAAEAFMFQAIGGSDLGAGRAMALRQGGAFASTNSMFADPKSPFYEGGFKGSDEMNISKIMRQMNSVYFDGKDRNTQDIGYQSLANMSFGGNLAHARQFKKTYDQYGASGLDTTSDMLKRFGIDPATVKTAGFTQLAEIANTKDIGGLQTQRAGMLDRKDLTAAQRASLEGMAGAKDPEQLRKALASIAATLDSEKTDGQKLGDMTASMDQNIQKLATELIPLSVMTNDLLGGLVDQLAPDSPIAKRRKEEQDQKLIDAATPEALASGKLSQADLAKANLAMQNRSASLIPEMRRNDMQFGLPPGTTAAFAHKESSFRANPPVATGVDANGKPYTSSARGMFQMTTAAQADALPGFQKKFGRAPDMTNASDAMQMFGLYYSQVKGRAGGNMSAADKMYFGGGQYKDGQVVGGATNVSEAQKDGYASDVQSLRRRYSGIYVGSDQVQIPAGNPEKAAATANANVNLSGTANATIQLVDQQMQNRGTTSVPINMKIGKPSASGSRSVSGLW